MTLPRFAADVLAHHVRFEPECTDRIYCNLYVPRLQACASVRTRGGQMRTVAPR